MIGLNTDKIFELGDKYNVIIKLEFMKCHRLGINIRTRYLNNNHNQYEIRVINFIVSDVDYLTDSIDLTELIESKIKELINRIKQEKINNE